MSTLKKPKYAILLVFVAVGSFLLGSAADRTIHAADNIFSSTRLLMGVLNLVNDNYVEEVQPGELIYAAIDGMLEVLDPHSSFLSKESFAEMGERFSGKFYGIGIEFDVLDGFLYVISVIDESPSEAVGLQSGDRIVRIDGESAIGIKHDEVRQKLRGEKGTRVDVTIERPGVDERFDVTITRDSIPIRSVRTSFMLEDQTGYIQLIRFAKTTSRELETALDRLQQEGMERLILDLRGNSGGYLDQAVEVSSKFIPEGRVIVKTMGRNRSSNQTFKSISGVNHREMPLVILLDHRSASASEIVAGAVQDWDRGVIAGTRSFGKGLVQTLFAEPHLTDGSALKLTTARYYTPSGRMIQRDYKNKSFQEYVEGSFSETGETGEAGEAEETGPEAESGTEEGHVGQADDADQADDAGQADIPERTEFTTAAGRTVYGDGGISPDVVIPAPKRTYPFVIGKYRGWLPFDRACFEFANAYGVFQADRQDLRDDFDVFLREFQVDEAMLEAFKVQVRDSGISFSDEEFNDDRDVIELQLKRSLARNLWGDEEASRVAAAGDEQLQQARQLFYSHEMLVQQ
ncbi:MAG: S41 family peptidase [Gemmatimonadetes bacterium]|nr:S41 family peptidase [Gemmatimonadota bacterium]MYD25692.1 S41 family peptidase [Gemmatimonadota bacterium]